jgi:hypothetical protein
VQPGTQPSPILLTPAIMLPAGSYGLAIQYLPTTGGPLPTGRVHPRFRHLQPTLSVADQFLTIGNEVTQPTAFASTPIGPHAACVALHYTVGPTIAMSQTIGAGCYQRPISFGETFLNNTTPSVDLSNQAFVLQPSQGTHYDVVPIASAIAPPVSAPLQQVNSQPMIRFGYTDPIPLPFTFTAPGGVSTGLITVSATGDVYLGGWNYPQDYPGSAQYFATGGPHFAVASSDWVLAPYTTGSVHFDVVPGNTSVRIIWNQGPYIPNGIYWQELHAQLVLHSDGRAEFHYGNVFNAWSDVTTGYSLGNSGSVEPVDLSVGGAIVPFPSGDGLEPARLFLDQRPVLGTTFTVRSTGVRPGTTLDAILLSLTGGSAIPLAGIGMPGCVQWIGSSSVMLLAPAGNHTVPIAVPNLPSFTGLNLFGQSVQFTPGWNPAALLVSNGLCMRVGI